MAILKTNGYTEAFLKEWYALQDEVGDLLHLIPHSHDHAEFLTYLVKNFRKGLDDFKSESVFVCSKCNLQATDRKLCTVDYPKSCSRD